MRQKILYIILPIILVLGIYGMPTSNETSDSFTPYNVKTFNKILIISVDYPTYKQGQIIHVYGKVNHYSEGTSLIIQIIDPAKHTIGNFNSILDSSGVFRYSFTIPSTSQNGKYLITAYYGSNQNKNQISLSVNISDNPGTVNILIPLGASSEANDLNFNPARVVVPEGTGINWLNNDNTVHTIFSGKINNDGTLALNYFFKNSYIAPGASLLISPTPGDYNYFCNIHPWLSGLISVTPNQVISKPNQVAATNPPSTNSNTSISDNVLVSIWKERKDLQKSYPEVAQNKLDNLKKWAAKFGWNEDKRLAALIPQGKVPKYLNDVLVSIWKERKDLQKAFPEVEQGNLDNLKTWATKTGWNEDKRLSVLIPHGKVPKY